MCPVAPADRLQDGCSGAERFYISNGLKKPNRVPTRDFVQRIQRLNGYVELLPCLFYSSKAAKSTKVCGPFDDADLASHILRMVPRNWQDQYELSGALVPQSVRELLEVLESIEKAYPTEKVGEGPKTVAKANDSSRKKMVSFSDRIRRNVAQRSTVLSARNMGRTYHPQHSGLRKYDSMGPEVKLQGEKTKWKLSWTRDLLEEEVAMRSYPLKSTNLPSPTRK
eukprot:CCRYP_006533-RA/>CCRYP_006533-RA protein AED:0.75 eAED:1.00 QI:0/-1/0/1/-1/1/1/0/223